MTTQLPLQLESLRTRPIKTLADAEDIIRELVRVVDENFAQVVKTVNFNSTGISTGWSMSNVTALRTMTATTITTAQLANVVGTLIQDLEADGWLE